MIAFDKKTCCLPSEASVRLGYGRLKCFWCCRDCLHASFGGVLAAEGELLHQSTAGVGDINDDREEMSLKRSGVGREARHNRLVGEQAKTSLAVRFAAGVRSQCLCVKMGTSRNARYLCNLILALFNLIRARAFSNFARTCSTGSTGIIDRESERQVYLVTNESTFWSSAGIIV